MTRKAAVAGDELDAAESSDPLERLDSWKEIAAHLKRDVTTVRRWEKREGLPVHRHPHERRDSVYAYRREIETWWKGRQDHLVQRGAANGEPGRANNGGSGTATTIRALAGFFAARSVTGWAVAAVLFVLTLTLASVLLARARAAPYPAIADRRFSVSPPPATTFDDVTLSPDGRYVAFAATSAVNRQTLLWLRSQSDVSPRPVPDTEGAMFPFWSPASDALGFFAGGKLWTVPVNGGGPRAVCDAGEGRGGTWNQRGMIVFAAGREGPLFQVPATGGDPVAVTTVDRPDERGHVWPAFLPDGNRFLYLADSNTPEHHQLSVGSLDRTAQRHLFALASNVAYTRDGFLIFARDRRLVAQRFDEGRLETFGEPLTLADRVHQPGPWDHKGGFAASDNGVLVYRTRQSPENRLVWRDRAGSRSVLIEAAAEYFGPTLSPDERHVAFAVFDPSPSRRFGYGTGTVRSDIRILDRETGTTSTLTTDPAADWGPVWAPDGRSLVFSSNRRGALELFRKDIADDHGQEMPLRSEGMNPVAQSWSRDGRHLLYSAFDQITHMDLWLLPISAGGAPVPLLRTNASEYQGQISPDGRWFAYTSDESGQEEVYVQAFPSPSQQKWKASSHGGGDPRWRSDGRELFYVAADRQLMSVKVKPGPAFEHADAVALFDTGVPPGWYEARNLYDVSRDGSFLFMTPIEDDRSAPFTIVIDWIAGFQRSAHRSQ